MFDGLRVKHILTRIDGFNNAVGQGDIKGIAAEIHGINAVAFRNACDLFVQAAGSKDNENFIGLFRRNPHVGPDGIHRIRVEVILGGQLF